MAPRKKPHTSPVLSKEDKKRDESPKVEVALPENHFNNVVRFIKEGNHGTVKQLALVLKQNCLRLKLKRRQRFAVPTSDESASSQFDAQSVYRWAEKIQPTSAFNSKKQKDLIERHQIAQKQLLALDATAVSRVGDVPLPVDVNEEVTE